MPLTAHDGQRRGSKDDGGGSGSGAGSAAGKAAPGKVTRTEQLTPPSQTTAQKAPPSIAQTPMAAAGAAPAPTASAKPASIHAGAAHDPLFRDGFVSTFVTPTPAAPALKVKNMTLRELHQHTQQHPEWASGALDADKDAVRRVLAFACADKNLVLNACGELTTSSLLINGIGSGGTSDQRLECYSRAANATRKIAGIKIYKAAGRIQLAIAMGEAIRKLEKSLPFATLERAVPQTDNLPSLEQLVEAELVDKFIEYVNASSPLLDSRNGKDVQSFWKFHEQDKTDEANGANHGDDEDRELVEYRALLPHIRNPHRFTKPQLDQLVANHEQAKTNAQGKKLPVCVVLQCATDASGAFHRDEQLTAVLARKTHVTLVAEGQKSLDAFSGALAAFAAFGAGGKVDEILISGHGGAKKIELAGDEAQGQPKPQQLTVDAGDSAGERQGSERLFATIAQSLREAPTSRVVLNACLTASHEVPTTPLPADPAAAVAKLRQLVAAAPSLATELQKRLGPGRQVIGANASFAPGTALLEPGSARIGIASVQDPALTGTKLQYLKQGIEPQGVLRAFVEVFAEDPKAALAAAKARCAALAAERAWRTQVLASLLGIACQHENDVALHLQLANCAGPLSALSSTDFTSVAALTAAKVPVAHRKAIFTALSATAEWAEKPVLAAVMLQGWMRTDPSKAGELRKLLNGPLRFTIGNRELFDLEVLHQNRELFLVTANAPLANAPYSDLFVAMLFLVQLGASADPLAKSYVKAVAAANGGTLPAHLYRQLLTGIDLAAVLANAGVATPAAAATAAAGTAAAGTSKPAPAAGSGADAKDRK